MFRSRTGLYTESYAMRPCPQSHVDILMPDVMVLEGVGGLEKRTMS